MILRVAATAIGSAALALVSPLVAQGRSELPPTVPSFGAAQSQFLLRCGGCHGTLGISPPQAVPVLRGRVGWFLCTPAGREYLVRLPNVARALLDDARLAGVLNFVAFDLGGTSAPAGAKPFTAEELAAIRTRPLIDAPLLAHRARVVKELIQRCGAPRDLLDYGTGTEG